ncbi:hypothetical protein V6N11_044420 [Hibiscus sabdariffa]|uniref:Xyloglucan endo-transglycosylase C-terminal domain-containing protein n=1 Tax=Hibiscus sabdariffa TaxID=183260 RepID=A0ABR2RFH8_9ROSI
MKEKGQQPLRYPTLAATGGVFALALLLKQQRKPRHLVTMSLLVGNRDDWNFNANACVWSNGASSCKSNAPSSTKGAWFSQEMDSASQQRLRWVRKNFMIYNYCTDAKRFPQGLPPECRMS